MYKSSLIVFITTLLILSSSNGYGQESSSSNTKFKTWTKTPPMGWNSFDCYGSSVTEQEVKNNADYMAQHLKDYGWEYVVIDIRWFVENAKMKVGGGYNEKDPIYNLDAYGRYLPSIKRFPSSANGKGFKELAKYIHGKGLKFGIHIMRGVPTLAVKNKLPIFGSNNITADQIYSPKEQCWWLKDNYTIDGKKPGAQQYYNSIFDLYAEWGVDFVKVDNLSSPYYTEEIEMIRKAIDQCGRPMVLSTSPGDTPYKHAKHIKEHANMWRMVGDVWDTWHHITKLFRLTEQWQGYNQGHTWPDCDMLPLGRIAIRGEIGTDRMTRLTKDEQYTLMTLWSIFRSPMMFGGDLPSNDAFTLSLLTNKEITHIIKNSKNNKLIHKEKDIRVWTAEDSTSSAKYLAVFNLSNKVKTKGHQYKLDLSKLGFDKAYEIQDLWSGESLGEISKSLSLDINRHGVRLLKLK